MSILTFAELNGGISYGFSLPESFSRPTISRNAREKTRHSWQLAQCQGGGEGRLKGAWKLGGHSLSPPPKSDS